MARKFRINIGLINTNEYTPWLNNEEFNLIYNKVQLNTLSTYHRCYELWNLIKESKKLSGEIIEIGTWRGGSGALIAYQSKKHCPNSKVYLCDTFKGVVKSGENDNNYYDGEHSDTSKSDVENLLKKLNLNNTKILEGVFPEETSHQIDQNEVFRFCHIDVDVYDSAKSIMDWIWPKIVPGGIIVFDDYGALNCSGIIKLVNEEKDKNDRLFIHNINGHAIFIKK
tara:strand:+ start:5959 stop:6633 length:675 start_codon:yes stop_codon:yes gene_type:complete